MASTSQSQAGEGTLTGFGSKGYRTYVLLALTLIYTLNFIDRSLLGVVGQPVMDTFGIDDFQWGFLNGPPFAIFYAVMGIPIAMWADRGNRVFIISLCIAIWSLMTVLCGLASGFIWLLVFRIGVAIGEAGCTPPANAIITDYYPPKSRVTALGVYAMGVTIGGVLAQLSGGVILGLKGADVGAWLNGLGLGRLFGNLDWTKVEGWRIAFVVVGAPGLLIAALLWLSVREPPRGYSDPPEISKERAGMAEAFKEFAHKPTFWWLSLGAAFVAFVGYGLFTFQAPFLQRVHGVSPSDAAIRFGAPLAAFAAAGTFLGGFVSEKLAARFPGAPAWVPAISLLLATPLYVFAFLSSNLNVSFALWIAAAIFHYAYLGAQYSVGTALVSPRSRATTISILLLIVALIGNGLGPLFSGWLSKAYMTGILADQGIAADLAAFKSKLCAPSKLAELGESGPAICSAYAEGLRRALATSVLVFILAALCYYLASRSFSKDRWRPA